MKESPGTSCAIYVNRKRIAQTGNPFLLLQKDFTANYNPKKYNPSNSQSVPLYCEFTPNSKGNAEIVILVSNYYYRKGGLWDSVYVGKAETLWRYNVLTLVFFCVVIGSLVFTGLLNLFQFATNKKRTEYFFLGIASLAFALRIARIGGERRARATLAATCPLLSPFAPDITLSAGTGCIHTWISILSIIGPDSLER